MKRKVINVTNEERIRKKIVITEGLAEYLVVYNDYWGMYLTSNGDGYNHREDAIKHEIEWLQSESEI